MMACRSPAGYLLALVFLIGLNVQAETTQGLVTEVEVDANIEHRYAVTRVTTRMYNSDNDPSQLTLHMTLPKDALVSSFILDVGGVNYSGSVRERQEARRTYEEASQEGRTAGLLELRDKDLQKLVARAKVDGKTGVTFHVTYEELVHRVQGSYRYTVHINPGQRIPRASVRIKVIEREAITNYTILELPGQEMRRNNPSTTVTGGPVSDGEVHLQYQHLDPPVGGGGVDGAFVLAYEITNHADGGEVQRVGSYFAHYFSPERLPRLTTHTVFLLDVSLSMYSTKLDSMKEALNTILREMQDHDTYEILAFSSEVVSIGTFTGEEMEVRRAIRRVRRLASLGYSNLNTALHQAIKATKAGGLGHDVVKQLIVFTDGQATAGETNPDTMRSTVKKANTEHYPIFMFIFSEKSKLLEDIGSDSGGFARYLNLDAALSNQITSFYHEISKPLMSNVTITYPEEEVEEGNVVKLGMSNYYSGGEIVVAGKLRPGVSRVRPSINARGKEGPHQLPATRLDSRDPFFASLKDNNVARMWAYLMMQELVSKAAATAAASPENVNMTQQLHSKALDIAMKFSFVSPLTSLVVAYPADKSILVSLPEGSQTLGDTQPGYIQLEGQRRGRRSTQNYVDLDPHFLVHTPGLDLPLCFNYEGRAGVSVRLLHDPQCGIVINGHVASVKHRPNIKFFSRLFLRLGPVNLTVTPESLQVDCLGDDGSPQVDTVVKSLWPFYKKNGRKYKRHTYRKGRAVRRSHHRQRSALHNEVTTQDTRPNTLHSRKTPRPANVSSMSVTERVNDCNVNTSWEEGVGRIYGNVMVVLSKKRSLDITIGDGLAHFTIRRSRNRKGQRFLGFYIRDQEIFSPQTHGMMGQFISKRVRRMTPNRPSASSIQTRAANTPEKVMLEVDRSGHRKNSHVSGVVGSRYSLMGRTKVRCIQVHTKGPGGVLDRQPRDYLLSCLQC